ncbi:MAG: cobaltochelatase subunit CobN, partial [Hyphomicrobiales bacterium]|nr:cobaltochelatase subunit CobN [Hyphomicrobiales bacterium]
QFDLVYDATCGDERVRDFLLQANAEAARAIAARFAEAERRGFWVSRRNSSARVLAEMMADRADEPLAAAQAKLSPKSPPKRVTLRSPAKKDARA